MNPRHLTILRYILATVFLLGFFFLGYLLHLLGKLNYVDPETMPTLTQEELDACQQSEETRQTLPPPATEEIEFEDHETQIAGSNIINILLIGQDRQEEEKRARSDSIILCTFNRSQKKLTMTSFLRDLYVQIPGYRNNRINAAYTAGGMELLDQTLEKNFGITVDGNIEVDFTQFSGIIDLLGGVALELRADEAQAINKAVPGSLTAGECLLSGQQALAYARIRKLDSNGDFSRTQRQRKLLTALVHAYTDASLPVCLSLLEEILPLITTDLSRTEILELAGKLFPLLPELELYSQSIPAEGTYSYQTIRKMAVLVADMDAARALLEKTLLDNESG